MNTFYVQIEVQVIDGGQKATIPTIFDNYNAALAKHYQVLSIAAGNTIPYHGSFIISSDGVMTDGRFFKNGIDNNEE